VPFWSVSVTEQITYLYLIDYSLLDGFRQRDGPSQSHGFINGFLVFVGGVGVGYYSGTGLDVGFAVF